MQLASHRDVSVSVLGELRSLNRLHLRDPREVCGLRRRSREAAHQGGRPKDLRYLGAARRHAEAPDVDRRAEPDFQDELAVGVRQHARRRLSPLGARLEDANGLCDACCVQALNSVDALVQVPIILGIL
eukprot:CAMPEP_0177487910 /NCGR_PEP_ID=MMETSP0369-20130122/29872_1 /TAXON_ID=447022 ORGANISM="Scrippsiella hangoei-like, Strain SHHI-4" /NCGR_SAMPLE_ID=MMETSP0369 /ASSEMBLY_ACC=CAM_ASM_000364 /LENGTH=128 /DNA_ID=CAMNT_0018964239 /DNA_START=227 /DNA_END=609 /DNA_ORIENTATION=-